MASASRPSVTPRRSPRRGSYIRRVAGTIVRARCRCSRLRGNRLASMSEIDAAPLNWSDLGVGELVPTGTVTLLLADVEGSTRLWETRPEEMTAAFHDSRPHACARGGRSPRRAADRTGRGRQLRDRLRTGQRRCGVRPRVAAGVAWTDPSAHRAAYGRGSAARRIELHRSDHQPHRPAARLSARRADGLVQHHKRSGRRPAAGRRVAGRSGQPSSTRFAPPGARDRNSVIPKSATNSRRSEHPKPLARTIFRRS